MTKFLALNISISEDGFMAGPDQTLDEPVGKNGKLVHQWIFPTKAFNEWFGQSGGETGVDNDFVLRGFTNIGATIMGRNMFGPVRGPWLDDEWKGWWGPTPAFQHPVFVLTHYPRASVDMGNGTIFHFITGGIADACEKAQQAAGDKDIRVGGGASTLQQFLSAGILDEIHLAQIPVVLGAGEKLFTDPAVQLKNYKEVDSVQSEKVLHRTYLKS